ncbi:2341_t:CDS:2 [Ambispora gerdemannii]|uniref:2341_t:CDS:1 n=1 Tax=Ambispora gerdemannii TaxID=144530 RepID=A0A9N8Z365_9GLOM|nr:2341_t:CDS:2 [Ambispora gerdemannii]
MLTELAISCSSTDSTIKVWDFRTSTLVYSFRQNVSPKNSMALLPFPGQSDRIGLVLAAQTDKPLIHAYSWQKEQIYQKLVCPDKLVSLVISNKGSYCAGGTEKGKIYVWELSTGKLCKVFDAHYRKVNILKFTFDDVALISGSDDAVVNVWLLCSILDESTEESLISSYYSWSSHSLPITDIVCGIGNFHTSRVLTSSLDNTCKVNLFREREISGYQPNNPNSAISTRTNNREVESVDGGGAVEGVALEGHNYNNTKGGLGLVFRGHSAGITAITLSYDSTILLSASEDGTVLIWDIASRQMLKTFTYHKGPVTNLSVFLKPPELSTIGSSVTASNKIPIPHISPFKKVQQQSSFPDRLLENSDDVVTVLLNSSNENIDSFIGSDINSQASILSTEYHDIENAKLSLKDLQSRDTAVTLNSRISELQFELLRIHEHYQRVKGLHDEMYQGLVEEFMRQRKRQ